MHRRKRTCGGAAAAPRVPPGRMGVATGWPRSGADQPDRGHTPPAAPFSAPATPATTRPRNTAAGVAGARPAEPGPWHGRRGRATEKQSADWREAALTRPPPLGPQRVALVRHAQARGSLAYAA